MLESIGGGNVTAVAAHEGQVFVGSEKGRLQSWRLPLSAPLASLPPPSFAPLAWLQLEPRQPVVKLQLLPAVGLILRLSAGVIAAHSMTTFKLVAYLHRSRATNFHADAAAPVAALAVCAGHALVWRYLLASPPRVTWKRLLAQPTRAVHLDGSRATVVCALHCYVLCATTGDTLAELNLCTLSSPVQQPSASWRTSACLVPLAELPEQLLLFPRASEVVDDEVPPMPPPAASPPASAPLLSSTRFPTGGAKSPSDVLPLPARLQTDPPAWLQPPQHAKRACAPVATFFPLPGVAVYVMPRRIVVCAEGVRSLADAAHNLSLDRPANAVALRGLSILVAHQGSLHMHSLIPAGAAAEVETRLGQFVSEAAPSRSFANGEDGVSNAAALLSNGRDAAGAEIGQLLLSCPAHPVGLALKGLLDTIQAASKVASGSTADRISRLISHFAGLDGLTEQRTAELSDPAILPCSERTSALVEALARFLPMAPAPRAPEVTAGEAAAQAVMDEVSPVSTADCDALAEAIVFGVVRQPLLALWNSLCAPDQQRLERGAVLVVRDGASALGVSASLLADDETTRSFWTAICTESLPSGKVQAVVDVCDKVAADVAEQQRREASAEELLPCVAYSLAAAIAAGSTPNLLGSLRYAQMHLRCCGARSKAGYCLVTVQVALQVVADQVGIGARDSIEVSKNHSPRR